MAKILIIDDERDILDSIATLLEVEGHETVKAINGKDGIKSLSHNKYDLVIIDVMMPDKSGVEVLSKMRHEPENSKTPVILISASQEPDTNGIKWDIFIRKPFDIKTLTESVQNILSAD